MRSLTIKIPDDLEERLARCRRMGIATMRFFFDLFSKNYKYHWMSTGIGQLLSFPLTFYLWGNHSGFRSYFVGFLCGMLGFHICGSVLRERRSLHKIDARDLLVLLERAQPIAERVDASRGRLLPAHTPLKPGESRGTDLAELISEIARRVRDEVNGPEGRE